MNTALVGGPAKSAARCTVSTLMIPPRLCAVTGATIARDACEADEYALEALRKYENGAPGGAVSGPVKRQTFLPMFTDMFGTT